jgi:Fe-S-cluster containining protein
MSSKDQGPSDIFNCIKCGDCCKGYGGTFVSGDEIRKIADYLKTDPERFVENYCQMSGGKPVLGQGKDGYCIFWEDICKIHPVKPRMCKRWPFIQSVLVDIQNWQIMSALCPGIRTDVPDRVVRECVKKILSKSE